MPDPTKGVARQYSDSRRVAARARLHADYTVAETPWFEWIARRLPLKPRDQVLDIGCGPGWFWSAVAHGLPEELHLSLVDQSPGMVEEAIRTCKALPLGSIAGRQGNAMELPFADETFDGVIAMHMLYHVHEPATAIAEMHRVLKPGGFLAATTNGEGNLRELYELTTAFGGSATEPVATTFGFDIAERLMRSRFGNVERSQHPASLRVTDPDVVFLALTSYPPGETASEDQLTEFREAIDQAFHRGHGVLEARKEMGLFISRKAA